MLDNDEREDSDVRSDDASTNGLAYALVLVGGPRCERERCETRGEAGGEEQTNTVGNEDTVLHLESLLVDAARNTKRKGLGLATEGV